MPGLLAVGSGNRQWEVGVTVLTELALSPGGGAERVGASVVGDLRFGEHWDVVVGLPPGAGKPTLVVHGHRAGRRRRAADRHRGTTTPLSGRA